MNTAEIPREFLGPKCSNVNQSILLQRKIIYLLVTIDKNGNNIPGRVWGRLMTKTGAVEEHKDMLLSHRVNGKNRDEMCL